VFQDKDFKDIEIEDKAIFDHYIGKQLHQNSEFNFTNFFIWRYHYKLSFTIYKDHLCLIGQYRNEFPIIFPPLGSQEVGFDDAFMKLVDYFKYKGFPVIVKGITDPIKEVMDQVLPNVFRYKNDRDMYDYVYLSDDLINLRGRKFQKKRNHINKFKKRYEYKYEPVTSHNLEECLIAEMEWALSRPNDSGINEEKVAIVEALRNMEALGIKGGALRVNDRIQAFSLGEELNPEMAVIHIEKANIDYDGSYAMINQQFAKHCWSDYKYINREEDMGLPGLRKAKKSYNPTKMIKKYTGLLK